MAGELNPRNAGSSGGPGRLALAALVLVVLVVHGWVTELLAEQMTELGLFKAMPARMEVVYVRDLGPAPAPLAAPAAPPAPVLAAPVFQPPKAASAPEPVASQAPRSVARATLPSRVPDPPPVALPEPVNDPLPAPKPEPEPELAEMVVAAASAPTVELAQQSAPASTSASAPEAAAMATPASSPTGDGAAPAFDWPVSTRVSYKLTGNVRGEVHGDAQVEWIRVGSRYQVHLDLTVGLRFAPLMTRRMSSDGDITPEGLSPRRYDQDTKVGFGARQRVAVQFETDAVVLANGQRRERWPGMQDTASQFIQLTYLFSTRPELLRSGASLDVPLALPRSISRWVYDVLEEEPVYTPIGTLTAFHLKPRRAVVKGGDLSAEIWFAPQLRYLPVRIRIQQDAETFIDLVIARKPQLAAP
jgi:Protein of unknown function (DUF3108)